MTPADARQAALERLYEGDQRKAAPSVEGLGVRATAIVEGVWASLQDLDDAIGDAAKGWRVERMPPVDRNVLRIALWELRHRPDTPPAVVISEAVRLAKVYSTAGSGRFVNGVLSRLAADTSRSG